MSSSANITVHSWSDAHLPNINPLVWVNHTVTPDAAANAAIAQLQSKPPGCKAIFHTRPLLIDVPSDRNSFTIANTADAYVQALRVGPDIAFPLKWTRDFYHRLKLANITPDWIVCDEEGGWSFWQIPLLNHEPNSAVFEKILSDPIVRSKMPSELLELSPRDFSHTSRHFHRAVLAYGYWTSKIGADALRKVVLDSATEIFGTTPNASNFVDVIPSFQIYDINGWELDSTIGSQLSNISSPAIYLVPGNRSNFGHKKHPCWNHFLDNLNAVRSCIVRGPVVPWISHPSMTEGHAHRSPESLRWLWTEQLRHVHATGVDTFLYWNPAEIKTLDPRADDQFAGEIFKDLATRPVIKRTLPEIHQDADQVISGNYITTYKEFEKNFPVE